MTKLKIALVCDWLTDWGGAERVIRALHQLYPEAPLYTTIYRKENFPELADADVRTSFLQNWVGAKRHHQWYLTFMPGIFEAMDLSEYDIVISSSHSCSKGVITKPETLHVSYCHSPPRYLWDNFHEYVEEYPWPNALKKTLIPFFLHRLRIWDRAAAERVDCYVANSNHIAGRIAKYYRKKAEVIHPPVSMGPFKNGKREDYFLAVGRLIPYKKFDLIVQAFNELQWPLKIVGDGNQAKRLKKMAKENIEFLGIIPEEELQRHYQRAKALIFPQVEDFGITPVEAMGNGCPVIAYAKGGALETVKNNVSGLFFHEQTVEALKEAIEKFQEKTFDPEKIRKQAEQFSQERFEKEFTTWLEEQWQRWTTPK